MKSYGRKLSACMALAISTAFTIPAAAQDTVKLKFADWFPTSFYAIPVGIQPWINDVAEQSKGTLTLEYYPAQQLGKAGDFVTLTQAGVADIAHISPAYVSDKFPLSGVAELPGFFTDACAGTDALATMLEEGGLLYEKEFKPQGLRPIWAVTYAPYVIMTTSKKVDSVADLHGLKLRTVGGAMDMTANAMGAVPVNMASPDVLMSLQRGTLDGMLVPLLALEAFDWQTVLKHMVTNVAVANFSSIFSISESTWNKLSDEQRELLTNTGNVAAHRICEYVMDQNVKIIASLKSKYGTEETHFDEKGLEELEVILASARSQWAKKLEGDGKDANAVVDAFTKNLAEKQQ